MDQYGHIHTYLRPTFMPTSTFRTRSDHSVTRRFSAAPMYPLSLWDLSRANASYGKVWAHDLDRSGSWGQRGVCLRHNRHSCAVRRAVRQTGRRAGGGTCARLFFKTAGIGAVHCAGRRQTPSAFMATGHICPSICVCLDVCSGYLRSWMTSHKVGI